MAEMPRLEYVNYLPWEISVGEDGEVSKTRRDGAKPISSLPQLFWSSGESWGEANIWALEKAENVNIETVKSLMKHLHAFACYQESNNLDWRHFPTRRSERAIDLFRGQLIKDRSNGHISSSTATERMRAVIQFYRFADQEGFVDRRTPMWREKSVVLPYYNAVGFKRSLVRITSDLKIPNRRRVDDTSEDGLMPLSMDHMQQVLEITRREGWEDLHLILSCGAFTGSRLGTITTLSIQDLEHALPDPSCSGIQRIRVGPGTGVKTKLDVSGEILVPEALLDALKTHAYSTHRLKREAKATLEHKSRLFLTVRSRPYTPATVDRLMVELRRVGIREGYRFLQKFKFHQTRATFGTWLMELCLSVTTPSAAIAFCKEAMLHKHESMTFRYIKFLNKTKGKVAMSERFSKAFTGIGNRNWDDYDA